MERERVPVLCVLLLAGFALQGTLPFFAAGSENRSEVIRCGESRPNCSSTALSPRILNGQQACPGQIPYQVGVRKDCGQICGGVIIDERHVLTAAHCVDPVVANPDSVAVGEYVLTENTDRHHLVRIEGSEFHDKYDGKQFPPINDIGIIRLAEKLEWNLTESGFGSVNRICMPDSAIDYKLGTRFNVSGWGFSNYGLIPNILRFAEIKLQPDALCYGEKKGSDICAVDGWKDASKGDSGGPLYRKMADGRDELAGLTSSGSPEKYTRFGIYTRVSNYFDWIETMIKKPKLNSTRSL